MNKQDILRILQKEFPNLNNKYNVTKLGIFGSFARDEQSQNSDLDILVDFKNGTPNIYDTKQQLKKYFRQILHRDVDIAREKYLKPYIRDEIMDEVIYVQQ